VISWFYKILPFTFSLCRYNEEERIERLEEKAMLEEGKAEAEGWDAGPERGGIRGAIGAWTETETTAAAEAANREGGLAGGAAAGGEGAEGDKKGDTLPAGTRWGASDEEEEAE
jgi:hypothetical protein